MKKFLLGIDNGNTVCKAVIFDFKGCMIAQHSQKIRTIYPVPGYSERNLDELWKVNAETIRQVITKAAVHPKQIVGVGSTGHGNGLYILDKNGRPLKGIQSMDSRAELICEEWNKNGLDKKVRSYTHQKFWASQTNTLLKWVQQFEPELYQQIGSVLLCKDYINYCITGVMGSDYTDMGATNLLDIKKVAYNMEILDLYGIDDIFSKLPQLQSCDQVLGKVSKIGADCTGLLEGTPVVTGMLDVDACMVGSGVTKMGEASIIAGSWSVNTVVTKLPVFKADLGMSTTFAVPNLWKSVEASATSVSNLEWFIREFCYKEQMEAKRRGVSVHVLCDEMVNTVLDDDRPLIFHPYLHGSGDSGNARAGFYGLAGWHTKADMLNAIYKGIVLGHLEHINKLRDSGSIFEKIRLTGGGSRSPVLCQMFADALNLIVEVPHSQETGTWGVAMAAGIGVGVFLDFETASDATVIIEKVYTPNTRNTSLFLSLYQEYTHLQTNLNEFWSQRGNIRN